MFEESTQMLLNAALEMGELPIKQGYWHWHYDINHLVKGLSREYKRLYRLVIEKNYGGDVFAETFVSEFYRIEKQLKFAAAFERKGIADLPRLASRQGLNKPRILLLASELMNLRNAIADVNSLTTFFDAYQKKNALKSKEIELLPEMLRIALIEMLNSLIKSKVSDSEKTRLLQNILESLQRITEADMEEAYRSLNQINRTLESDDVYRAMDNASKNLYLFEIAKIAKKCAASETAVAALAVKLAKKGDHTCSPSDERRSHVGFFIVDEGRNELIMQLCPDKKVPTSLNATEKIKLFMEVKLLFTAIVLLTLALEGAISVVLALLPISAIVNCVMINILTRIIRPKPLPRLSFEYGIGKANRTLVCVPVLITSENSIKSAMKTLESHYLASRLDNTEFAVLGDFPDLNVTKKDGESELIALACRLVDELNEKYGKNLENRFHYLHRGRVYNAYDDLYMGRERKRGAVNALMRILTKCDDEEFICNYPELERNFRYLTVLDADTVMPSDALRQLIGTAAHPLNQPCYKDESSIRPSHGYTIIAPRMAATSRSAAASRFAYLVSGDSGMSPYNNAVSDFYQDVFEEGCFGGKGIIDILSFMRATEGVIPDNTVLSHDMLEGCLSRAAFSEDIVLYDGEPASFNAWWKRRHRWLRGDFQLLPFLIGKERESTDVLAKYKIADNIKRGLLNLSLFTALFAGCVFDLPRLFIWALVAFFIDPIIGIIANFAAAFRERVAWRPIIILIRRRLMELATLPYAALRDVDAIIRALYRMFYSHKKMLEWQTAADSKSGKDSSLFGYIKLLLPCEIIGILLIAVSFAVEYSSIFLRCFTLFLGMLKMLSPVLIKHLDGKPERYGFTENERTFLIELFKRTWRYFDDNCTEESYYLPPDNFQEEPYIGNASLTSPTNIGMGIMAVISAKDMEFIDENGMLLRLSRMVDTIERMEKWNGHLFNWYNLKNLSLLKPRFISSVDSGNLFVCLVSAAEALNELKHAEASALAARFMRLAKDMDFTMLYDNRRKLFHIGLEFDEGRLTNSWYDLLASESRLMSFAAIAFSQVGKEHWLRLSRLMSDVEGGRVLKSWSGTLFEYLMPLIFMETVPQSMQYEVCRNAVITQILASGGKHPWGVSESGYYAFDRALRYQYRAFGTPSLGLAPCRERSDVIAPYAGVLALMIEPKHAVENLMELERIGALGKYGMYEAIDYTGIRIGDRTFEIVRSFMAHHQGMSLCAINNALNDDILKKRFMNLAEVRANEQLLFENMPANPIKIDTYESCLINEEGHIKPENYIIPGKVGENNGGIISNGNYSVFINSEGRGLSKCANTMLTRFDRTLSRQNGIEFIIKRAENVFDCGGKLDIEPHKLSLSGRHGSIKTRLEVITSAEFNCEVRSLNIINCGRSIENLEVGVFAEVSLAEQREDEAHPAFVRICIDSEFTEGAVIFNSRKRPDREERFGFFSLTAPNEIRYCTDGLSIPGRLLSYKEAMKEENLWEKALENPKNNPVEPYFSAITRLCIAPGESIRLLLIAGFAYSRSEALDIIKEQKLRISGAEALARAQSKGMLRSFGIDSTLYMKAQVMAHRILTGMKHKKPLSGIDAKLHGISELWRLGISGDRSIVLMPIKQQSEINRLRAYIKILLYLDEMGVEFDLVVVGEYPHEYANRLQINIEESLKNIKNATLLHGFLLNEEDRAFLVGMASIVIDDDIDSMDFYESVSTIAGFGEIFKGKHIEDMESRKNLPIEQKQLINFNGYGGFDKKAGEYVIYIRNGKKTPLPWSNIIANEQFGTLVTESGGGFTFMENARLFRLTPWYNDAVHDTKGERLIAIDFELGKRQSLTPSGLKGDEYEVRHGYGYSIFNCKTENADYSLTETVDGSLPIKYYRILIKNKQSERIRRSILLSIDWVMGEKIRKETIYTEGKYYGVVARNLASDIDKLGFIALKSGAKLMEVASNEILVEADIEGYFTHEVILIIGSGGMDDVEELISKADFKLALRYHQDFANNKLDKLRVRTEDENFDAIINGHILYQTYASRLMGRTGFYQSGGAFGFRDQLQDVLALLLTDQERAREQIILCASKQFEQGDVLHWWHGDGRGVRTYITDDRLFLPYVAAEYAFISGDFDLFEEMIPYLEDAPIPDGRRDLYQIMRSGNISGSLYEHCMRAIECSLNFGAHGIPLMGSGDWNDSMDSIGENGGESVALGWFTVLTIEKFIPICEFKGKDHDAEKLKLEAEKLRENLEKYAWNGNSYVRAFFHDGTPLGGCGNGSECEIDCVSECFAIFAGAKHSEEAFEAVLERLVDNENGLIKLLTPPFNGRIGRRIGYIEGYLPGIRENGGQYTHAAAWCVIAACMLGKAEMAQHLFRLINPAEHGGIMTIERYRGEPYAVAGDVYSEGRLAGRAGWTWYTGAAGWLYRAAVEHILGLKKVGNTLKVLPCTSMSSFEVDYRYGESGNTMYKILAKRTGRNVISCDGESMDHITLFDDEREHTVLIEF